MTIGQVRGWAISRLHLDRESFGLLRPGEFWEAMLSWIEDRNAERQHTSEVIRAVGLRLFNIQLAMGKSVKAHEFLPFPWDAEEDDGMAGMTEEEKRASIEELMKHVNW